MPGCGPDAGGSSAGFSKVQGVVAAYLYTSCQRKKLSGCSLRATVSSRTGSLCQWKQLFQGFSMAVINLQKLAYR